MLDKKPALPSTVNPKNVALRLFFRDANVRLGPNKITQYEEIVTHEQLYRRGNVEFVCGELANIPVKISYIHGFLLVKTSGAVDIYLSGDIPAQAIYIETTGDCVFVNGQLLASNLRMYVAGRVLALYIPITNAKFIALLPGNTTTNAVLLGGSVASDKLILKTNDLQLEAPLLAGKALVTCKQMHPTKLGGIIVTEQPQRAAVAVPDAFDNLVLHLLARMDTANRSEITIDGELLYAGVLNVNTAKVPYAAKIKFMPHVSSSDLTVRPANVVPNTVILKCAELEFSFILTATEPQTGEFAIQNGVNCRYIICSDRVILETECQNAFELSGDAPSLRYLYIRTGGALYCALTNTNTALQFRFEAQKVEINSAISTDTPCAIFTHGEGAQSVTFSRSCKINTLGAVQK